MSVIRLHIRDFFSMFRARLSLRIVLWIFLSLVIIEALILVPSVQRRKQEILGQIEDVSSGKVNWILMTYPEADGEQLLTELRQLSKDTMLQTIILGGAVYRDDGELVGSFGEMPAMSFAMARQTSQLYQQTSQGLRYDVSWIAPEPNNPYVLVLRHNATGTRQEVFFYILRICGLVIIIAAFVTVVVMVSLGSHLIRPILTLRRDLALAGDAIARDRAITQFESHAHHRPDELGEVIETFSRMYAQIEQAINERKKAEAELRQKNEQMQQYLTEVDRVTAAAGAVEQGSFQADSLESVAQRSDELGMLARMFQQMAKQVQAREQQLKQQLMDLRIEIDQKKCEQEVTKLTESSYFQEVQREVAQVNLDEFWGA
jgi:methyl-accepting chemotaxis protein